MLLLNGGFMSMAAWQPCAVVLEERYRVLRCDFRGQLLTAGPAHRELAPNVDDVRVLLDHLGLGRVHVLGTSFGGEVGLLLAARHPDRVRSLVAATVSDRSTPDMEDGARRLRRVLEVIAEGGDRGAFHDLLVEDVYSGGFVRDNAEMLAERRRAVASLPDTWFAAVSDLVASVEDFDLRDDLRRIACPTLVVIAGDDRVMPPERGRAAADAIPGARVVEHATSGHALVAEHPEWLARRAMEHFAGSGGDDAG